jgi:hypothetical protein
LNITLVEHYRMRGKKCTHLQTGLGGQGPGLEVQNFAWIFFQHTGFMENQKNWGSPTGLAPRCQIVRVTHRPPMQILGFWGGFWGLEWATGVRLQCFWSQRNGISSKIHMQSENIFFVTPIFQGPWFPNLGPWGSCGSNGPDLTILNYCWTPLTPQSVTCFLMEICLHICNSEMGLRKEGPLPWFGVQNISKRGLSLTCWSGEKIPPNILMWLFLLWKYLKFPKGGQIGGTLGVGPPI